MDDELLENDINRNEILENISEIFIRYGVRSSSMDDIARYLKMSKKTLYGMFENKNDVVDKVVEYRKSVGELYIDSLNMSNIDPIPYLYRKMVDAGMKFTSQAVSSNLFDVKKYHPEVYQKHFREVNPKSIEVIRAFFDKGIADGVFRENTNKDLQVYLFFMQLLSLAEPELNWNQEFDTYEVITTIIENFIRSIATPKGLMQLELEDLIEKTQ
jgi:AcrR family transcriptional regulator